MNSGPAQKICHNFNNLKCMWCPKKAYTHSCFLILKHSNILFITQCGQEYFSHYKSVYYVHLFLVKIFRILNKLITVILKVSYAAINEPFIIIFMSSTNNMVHVRLNETLYFSKQSIVEFINVSLLENSPILYDKIIFQFLLDSVNVSELSYLTFITLLPMIKFTIKYL